MKSPIMLVCAMMMAMGASVWAEEKAQTAVAEGAEKAQVQIKHGPKTEAQREAMMNKRLERIKAKDEALYKELVALKEKDPAAFKAKMRELAKADAAAAKAKAGEGKIKGQGKAVAPATK